MKRFLLILLCLLMVVGMAACGKTNNTKPAVDEDEDNGPVVYAADEVINRYFVDFIETYNGQYLDLRSIRRAPGTTNAKPEDLTKEYLATINGLNVTLRNATYEMENDQGEMLTMYQLRIIIEGGTTAKSLDTMLSVFSLMAQVADSECSAATADKAADAIKEMKETGEYRVSTYLKVERYTPIVAEYGVPCKLEMVAYNYAPEAE